MATVFCTQCGAMNDGTGRFCNSCGALIDGVEEGAVTAPQPNMNMGAGQTQVNAPQYPMGQVPPEGQPYGVPVYGYAQPPAPQPKSHTGLIIGIIAGVTIIIILLILFLFGPFSNQGSTTPASTQSSSQNAKSSAAAAAATQSSTNAEKSSASAAATAKSSSSAAASTQSDYVLKDSNTRYYGRSELEKLSNLELYRARNEIYARHGRGFKNADLKSYFSSKSWYKEQYTPEQFDSMASPLNDYERKNAELMLSIEKDRKSEYL